MRIHAETLETGRCRPWGLGLEVRTYSHPDSWRCPREVPGYYLTVGTFQVTVDSNGLSHYKPSGQSRYHASRRDITTPLLKPI